MHIKSQAHHPPPVHSAAQLSYDLEDTLHIGKRLCDWKRWNGLAFTQTASAEDGIVMKGDPAQITGIPLG